MMASDIGTRLSAELWYRQDIKAAAMSLLDESDKVSDLSAEQ